MGMLEEIADGRTDLVFEYLAQGYAADSKDQNGVSLLQWCAYYGDVSAMKFLLSKGEVLDSLGKDFGLSAACFHGHWRLCKFLIERSADVNYPGESGETPLHATLCSGRPGQNLVLKILLAHGASPNCVTKAGTETAGFMRDVHNRGETPLHRAAAFADEEAIQLLLDAGAAREAKDVNGDSPLSWASWHQRPTAILRRLCYGNFRIHPEHASMETYLRGKPHT